jgi:serine/threonine protein phosphatase PrpC
VKSELNILTGHYSIAGVKPVNEDCGGTRVPNEAYALDHKGVVVAIADGVSSAEAGKEASHTSIERFINEYYKTPDTWSVAKSGQNVLSALNLHLYRKSHEFDLDSKGYLTTFCAVIIKGQTAHFFHVGDSRIYHLRDGVLKLCTTDHSAPLGEGRTFLSRAIGMDNVLHIDYGTIALEEGDRFLLSTDGVHDFLDQSTLKEMLLANESPDVLSQVFVDSALSAQSDDNISAVVAFVKGLPEENADDHELKLTQLPFPPDMYAGVEVDGYVIEKELFSSSRSQVYLVRDEQTGQRFAMKTPSINFEEDASYIARFIREEWVGSRVHHDNIVKIVTQTRSRSYLYYLMEYVEGIGLDKWMLKNQPPSPKQAIAILEGIASGLTALHDNETIHQDLKPGNVVIKPDMTAVIIDFGSVFVSGLAELANPVGLKGVLGTASYSDPLYLQGKEPSFQADVYSLGCIAYEIFTGHLPYGDKIEECQSAFDFDQLRYVPAFQYNPVVPEWFNGALKKSVAFDLDLRYTTVQSMLSDLRLPNPDFLQSDPIVEKKSSQLLFWKMISGFWFVTFLLLIYLFSTKT